jgi:hypothetical protein
MRIKVQPQRTITTYLIALNLAVRHYATGHLQPCAQQIPDRIPPRRYATQQHKLLGRLRMQKKYFVTCPPHADRT